MVRSSPSPRVPAYLKHSASGQAITVLRTDYVGKIYDASTGRRRKTRVFVMTLGFSRRHFAHFVHDQRIETWLDCHILAFEHFGGVPAVVVPANCSASASSVAAQPALA